MAAVLEKNSYILILWSSILLYHLLVLNLSIVRSEVVQPDLSSGQDIVAFSISTCSAEVGQFGIVYRLK